MYARMFIANMHYIQYILIFFMKIQFKFKHTIVYYIVNYKFIYFFYRFQYKI